MSRILMILAFCTIATSALADTQLTPWIFDLRKQFDECINAPSDNPYISCQGALAASYTLRREIGYALDDCHTANVEGCVTAFNDAGFPAQRLNIATLERCTMLGKLEETDILEIPENSCIEKIARTIEHGGIPTTHNTDISCGINYIECAEIVGKGTEYWEKTVWIQHIDKLQTIPHSDEFSNDSTTSHRYYSLLERQITLQIDLAEITCQIQTVIPHWANLMDYEECMGNAYMEMWIKLKEDGE